MLAFECILRSPSSTELSSFVTCACHAKTGLVKVALRVQPGWVCQDLLVESMLVSSPSQASLQSDKHPWSYFLDCTHMSMQIPLYL